MSKKLLTLFVFGLLSAPVYCMDRENDPYGNSGTSSMVPSSSSSSSSSATHFSSSTAPSSAVLFPTDTNSSVPSLLALSASASVKKLTSPEGIKQFLNDPRCAVRNLPDDMEIVIVKQIIEQHGIPLKVLKALMPKSPFKTFKNHKNNVYILVFNRQGTMLATGSKDNIVCLYDISDANNPKLVTTLCDHGNLGYSLIFNQEGTLLKKRLVDNLLFLSFIAGQYFNRNLIKTLRAHGNRVTTLAFNPQGGTLLATGSDDHTVCLYDISDSNNPKLITKLQNHSGLVTALAFNPQDTLLAVGLDSGIVHLYDMNTYHEAMDFIKKGLTTNQALFLLACDKNKLYLSGHPHLIAIFEQFPKSFQKALVDAGLVVLPSSWMAPGIIGGIAAAVAGYAFYSYLKK